jgi:hypothetical protein
MLASNGRVIAQGIRVPGGSPSLAGSRFQGRWSAAALATALSAGRPRMRQVRSKSMPQSSAAANETQVRLVAATGVTGILRTNVYRIQGGPRSMQRLIDGLEGQAATGSPGDIGLVADHDQEVPSRRSAAWATPHLPPASPAGCRRSGVGTRRHLTADPFPFRASMLLAVPNPLLDTPGPSLIRSGLGPRCVAPGPIRRDPRPRDGRDPRYRRSPRRSRPSAARRRATGGRSRR